MILAIALIVLAFVLIILELTFPSFGLLSLGAAAAYAFSLVIAFGLSAGTGWSFIGAGILLLPMAIGFGLKILPNTPIGRRLFLKGPDASEVAHGTLPEDLKELVGHTGLALTDLRPAGTARIAGRRVDVIADGRFVERGGGVRVLGVNGTRVVVQAT